MSGIDNHTVLMLHMNDNTFKDECEHTVTNNSVALNTSVKKFGNGSGNFDGINSYLQLQSDDFVFGNEDFSIDFWIYFPSDFTFTVGMAPIYIGGTSIQVFSPFSIRNSSGTVQSFISGDTQWSIAQYKPFTTIVRDEWLHWYIGRNGNTFYLAENGVIKSTFTSTESIVNPTGGNILFIGKSTTDGDKKVKCYIDEFRISKGIARWTSDFTPPTHEYTSVKFLIKDNNKYKYIDNNNNIITISNEDILYNNINNYGMYDLTNINSNIINILDNNNFNINMLK